jgi:hypothetical protein
MQINMFTSAFSGAMLFAWLAQANHHQGSGPKSEVTTMSATPNTPVAPVVGKVGSSVKGGHIEAYRAQAKFLPSDTLRVIPGTNNPWRPGTPGHAFYTAVLANGPATVGAAIEMAAKSKPSFRAVDVQGHLRWLYTWGGAYLEVNGKLYSSEAPAAPAKAPAKGKVPAKAPAKAN